MFLPLHQYQRKLIIYFFIFPINYECKQSLNNFRFNDSGLSTYDASLSRSTDTTDGISSFYMSLSDQRSAILEEKQEDFVSYTPLDRGSLIVFFKIVPTTFFHQIVVFSRRRLFETNK